LRWATSNGAGALGWGDELGSFERRKKPGVDLINSTFAGSKRII
jgi:cytosine/adenosine deaminase-related metal-dependent hydrolase